MAPIDGAIGMKINLDLPQTTDVNISKAQPSKASGLGGVRGLRSKSAPILYKYRFTEISQANSISKSFALALKLMKRQPLFQIKIPYVVVFTT